MGLCRAKMTEVMFTVQLGEPFPCIGETNATELRQPSVIRIDARPIIYHQQL